MEVKEENDEKNEGCWRTIRKSTKKGINKGKESDRLGGGK